MLLSEPMPFEGPPSNTVGPHVILESFRLALIGGEIHIGHSFHGVFPQIPTGRGKTRHSIKLWWRLHFIYAYGLFPLWILLIYTPFSQRP